MVEKSSAVFVECKKKHNPISFEFEIWQNDLICTFCKTNIGGIANISLKKIGKDLSESVLVWCNSCNDFRRVDIVNRKQS